MWKSLKGFKYNPTTIGILKKIRLEDEDKEVRVAASMALWQLGVKDAFTEEEWKDLEERGVIID